MVGFNWYLKAEVLCNIKLKYLTLTLRCELRNGRIAGKLFMKLGTRVSKLLREAGERTSHGVRGWRVSEAHYVQELERESILLVRQYRKKIKCFSTLKHHSSQHI